jgi:hypothetical protein
LLYNQEGESNLGTTVLRGTGYLFLGSIPNEEQGEKEEIRILYHESSRLATFSVVYPEARYSGSILNFTDFVEGWEIPAEGLPVDYAGILYQKGVYLSLPPAIGGNFLLTTFREHRP